MSPSPDRFRRRRPDPALALARAGFTLLEVLVALVIIGVALAAAMRGAMALTDAAEDTRMKLIANLAAENRLLELRLARRQLQEGQALLECTEGSIVFRCEQNVKPTPNVFFKRVELRVSRLQGDRERRYAEFMIVLPTNQ